MFKKLGIYGTGISIIFVFFFGSQLLSTVEKGTFEVRQFPVTGTIDIKNTAGTWCKCGGNIDVWNMSETFDFDGVQHPLLPVRFNDGSASQAKGEVRVVFPSSQASIENLIAMGYSTQGDIMERLVYPHLSRVMRLTGNFMTAKESFDEKRADFDSMSLDQLQYGVYKTETKTVSEIDPITGKTRNRAYKVVKRTKGGDVMREATPLEGTGITFNAYVINSIKYPKPVLVQIEAQRTALMEVQTARANAKKAEQDAKTIEMTGKANVMTAKYEEEQDKVRQVVKAERKLEVAKLAKLEAEQYKQQQILKGQGEGERKRLVMVADGALAQKLEAWTTVNAKYAEAIQNYKGNWVSTVSMGGEKNSNSNGADDLINLFKVKTAKDLALDMSIKSRVKGK